MKADSAAAASMGDLQHFDRLVRNERLLACHWSMQPHPRHSSHWITATNPVDPTAFRKACKQCCPSGYPCHDPVPVDMHTATTADTTSPDPVSLAPYGHGNTCTPAAHATLTHTAVPRPQRSHMARAQGRAARHDPWAVYRKCRGHATATTPIHTHNRTPTQRHSVAPPLHPPRHTA